MAGPCLTISMISNQEKKRKYEPPVPTRVGKKKKRTKGPDAATRLPGGTFLLLLKYGTTHYYV